MGCDKIPLSKIKIKTKRKKTRIEELPHGAVC